MYRAELFFINGLDIQPYDYQKEVLEQLHAQRTLYGRTRNLIAATGVCMATAGRDACEDGSGGE
ncbi:hypothetical protein J2W91_004144 [Paenibacillus amylolyticus]|uniref:Uncharacterized protein n=1 Tax=Paenibacillus amylolyticus TaxID=1451 RepID=A0AAP5H4D9_PAEAM|nr:hypothetical protein [Paenibacillus amylolyticus]MDR6725642.1 hypothetical protein [Paenibacillus amylolyticus]